MENSQSSALCGNVTMSKYYFDKYIYDLKIKDDLWQLEEILHDCFYLIDLIDYNKNDGILNMILYDVSYKLIIKWKYMIPFITLIKKKRDRFIVSFQKVLSYEINDRDKICMGDITSIYCSTKNIYEIRGSMPTYIILKMNKPYTAKIVHANILGTE